MDCLPGRVRILNLGPGAGPDITVDVDHEDLIGHIDFPFVHVVQHLLGPLGPDLIITGVPKKTNADDNVSFQRKTLLFLHHSQFPSLHH